MRRLANLPLWFVPGLGQARNGQRRKALAVALAFFLLIVLGLFTPWIETAPGLVSFLVVLLAAIGVSWWDARRCRGAAAAVTLRVVDRVVLLAPLALVVALALPGVRDHLLGVRVFRIPDGNTSGFPTLLGGDRILARMERGRPERGALALFEAPGDDRIYVKRVVALAGEVVRGGSDGIFVGERRVSGEAVASFGPVAVGDGEAFLLGDHPCCSRDSREFGPIAIGAIIGRPLYVVWGRTCDRFGKTLLR